MMEKLRAWRPPDLTVKPLHVIVIFVIFVGALWAAEGRQNNNLEDFASGLSEQTEQIILDGCKRGNLRSAYELANKSDGGARTTLAKEVLPIVNCEKTQALHHYTTINRTVQARYVRIVVQRHLWPQVSLQGQIIGFEPLPAVHQQP